MASRGIRYTNDHQHNREPVVSHPLRRENSIDYVIDQPRPTLPTSYSRDEESAQGRRNSDNEAGFSSTPSPQMPPASALPTKNRLDPAVTSSSPSQALIVMDAKKLGHAPIVGRRKSGGSGGEQMALRSPVVKRPVAAPVALQGWLHKQGSEGLMLWKKRWFVLSEYCLFYYKSSEEEKLLGSILLPSYKISPCSPEDRVYRKFAFKAEHVNMRTYYFAADSRELMVQWMNALSLASILQEGINWEQHRNGRPSVSSISSMLNQSNDDSDSGFHGYRTRTGILPKKSKSEEGQLNTSHDSTISNGWGIQRPAGFQQPLYANAPPKPRRLTDREGMSSPEPTPEKRLDGSKTPDLDSCKVYTPRTAQPQQPVAIRNDRGGIDLRYHYQAVAQTPQWIQQPPPVTQPPSAQVIVPNAERRTPDTYGRSNSTTPGPIKVKGSDYEDVYNNSEARQSGGQMYRRPSGQVAYLKGAGPPIPFPQTYPVEIVPSGQYGQSYYRYPNQGQPTSVQNIVYSTTPTHQSVQTNRQRSRPHPPRPHSADFLEYDARRYYQEQVYYQSNVISRDQSTNNIGIEEKMSVDKNNKARLPRPKSSLDVIGPGGVGVGDYYWSEESYAQKMRQSASYLHHTPTRVQQSSRATTPSVRLVTPIGVNAIDGGPVGGTSSGGSVASEVFRTPKRTEVDVKEGVKMRSNSQQQQHQDQQRRWSEYADSNFMRSASARLPRSRYDDENVDSLDEDQRQKSTSDIRAGNKKIQQREESMQRLLEWKQRMLQSPLSRKLSSSSNAHNEYSKYYKRQALRELANHEARSRDDDRGPRRRSSHQEDSLVNLRSRSQDGRRSSTPLNRYNSYSSDDEELGEDLRKSRKRVRRPSQAGRSSRRHPQNGATPDYENVSLVNPKTNPNIIQRDIKDPRESKSAPREEILPDAAYDIEYHIPKEFRNQSQPDESGSQCSFDNKSHNRVNRSRERKASVDVYMLPSEGKSDRNYRSSPSKNHKSENNIKGDGLPSMKKLGNTTGSSTIPDDSYSNGKHSDSGYDTLQIGRAIHQDLQKFPRSGLDSWKRTELVYPLQEVQWNTDGINLNESRFGKEISYQYVTSENDTNVPGKKAESSPKNIVQNRIKAFEDEGVVRVATNVTIKMQEPLKVSPPMYQPFEAHVSNLRSSELSPDDSNKIRLQNVKSFALGDSRSSPEDNYNENDATKCNVQNVMKQTNKHTKSVKDLLADFERKSQLVKERQAAEEERSSEGGPGKRFVFSDTETLLYDTSSDGDGNEDKKRSLPIHIRQRSESRIGAGFSDDDDKDEEVAAALGKTDKFFSSCRDLGRNRDLYFYGERRRKRKTSRGSDVSAANNLEAIVTPGYLRLSMAESLGTHEDEESLCCTPTDRQVDVETVTKDVNETVGTDKLNAQDVIEEYYMPMTPSRKAVLAPPDAFKNHSAIMENIFGGCLDFEESSYVEMSENRHGRSLLAPNSSSFTSKFDLKRLNSTDSNATYATPDSPRYCEIGKGEASHYEFLCKASTQYEPVYMEVSPLMDILKDREDAKKSSRESVEVKDNSDSTLRSGGSAERLRDEALDVLPPTPPRLSLPDICSSPNTSTRKTLDRDSSDADDEASKDLDSLDAPRHPRFSLSDTFRPASYYLGASSTVISGLGIATEHQDSSDSDLVSPPPIPTSPPPLDDFETSLELQDSSLEIKKSPSLEKTSEEDVRRIWSKTPLPKSPSNSEAVELRHSDSEERMLKRRPVSDDLIDSLDDSRYLLPLSFVSRRSGSDLDSIGSRSGLAMNFDDGIGIDLDKYLDDLQSRDAFNVDLCSKEHNYGYYRSYQDLYGLNDNYPANTGREIEKNRTEKSIIPDGHRTSLPQLQNLNSLPFNLDISNQNISLPPPNEEEVHYENLQMILPPPPEHASEPSDQDMMSERSSMGSRQRNDVETIRSNVTKETEEEQAAGAPYYYSDLLKTEEDGGFLSSNSDKSFSCLTGFPGYSMVNVANRNNVRLNNQRGDSEGNFMYKRNDVGRKVNPINPEIIPPPYVPSSEEEGRLLAQELRTSTVRFLDAADKRGQVDVRNLYESDTLQRRKPEPHLHGGQAQDVRTHPTNTVNLYPHGIRDKSSPSTSHDSPSEFHGNHQRRSRSLEGLLDDPEFLSYNAQRAPPLSTSFTTSLINVPQSVTAGRLPNVSLPQPMQVPPPHTQRAEAQTPSVVPHETVACEGDDMWEEDTLWRDSLRRVSLRHTRSLDNLDGSRARSSSRLSNTSVVTASTVEQSSGRRSVDVVSGRKINREVTYVNDSMVRGQLPSGGGREYEEDYREGRKRVRRRPSGEGEDLRDDGVHYERLSRFSESLERTRRGQTYIEGYVWDEDRETFRKGLSSARDEEKKGNESPQAFLEDASLPPPAPSFEIDREKLRQWDLMSSAPLRQGAPGVASPGEGGRLDQTQPHKGATDGEDPRPPSSTASGSGSVIGRDPLPPRSISTAEITQPGKKSPPTITVTTDEKAQSPGDHRNHVITHPPDNHRNHMGGQSPGGDPRTPDHRNHVITKPPENHRNHVIIQPLGDPRNHLVKSPVDHRNMIAPSPVDHRNMIAQSPDRRNYGVSQSPGDLRNQVMTQEPSDYRTQADYSNYALGQDSGSNGRLQQTSGDYRNHTVAHGMGDRSHSVSSPGLSSPNQYSQTFGDRDSNMSDRADTLERKEKKPQAGNPWSLTVSAGELLGRTHEELVLLLIQLRRQSAGVCKAMETCHIEIEAQARLAELETPQRLEHLQRLEDLKRHLLELEKQYEKGKPLVNLVDNMVKLGSLYRGTGTHLQPAGIIEVPTVRERLEFNQKVQEQRLLAEERKDWNRLSPDRGQLQAKVQELYRLDRLLQEESGTLQSLQQDKELLEKALGGLRHKLQGGRSNPAEAERYRKQQRLLERELSRVRMLLAHNSKKLEETVAENARLEQELVVIRQKLQASRRGSLQHPALHRSAEQAGANTAALEAELRRVQQLVGDLQRQRQELSIQVRQLTEKSHNLVQQIRPGPTGVSGAGAIPGRKRHHTTWLETDLDSLVTLDHGLDSPASPQHPPPSPGVKTSPPDPQGSTPLYMNTELRRDPSEYEAPDEDVPPPLPVPPELPPDYPPPPPPPPSEEALLNGTGQYQLDISEADDRMKRFYGIIPREKPQEIKTVRIVKRESERRQKERDRSGNIGIPITNGNSPPKRLPIPEDPQLIEKQPLDRVLEEDQMLGYEDDPVLMQFQRSMSLPRGFGSRGRLTYQQPPPPPVRDPALRGDSHTALRNLMIARHRVRFESGSGGSSSGDSVISQRTASPSSSRGLTAHEQLFGVNYSSDSPQLSPVFKSEAARAIVMEMATMREDLPQKRVIPKEKRRHHTVSSGRPLYDVDSTLSIMGSARSRDDLDMERALRPRLNAPDVVRSTMSHKDFKYNENTIDNILGTPNKILIPERYIPEQVPEMSAEEQEQRLRKAESIRKMLSETSTSASEVNDPTMEDEQTSTLKKKVQAEKRQREHLLQLNQILAKQVMEKSKMVAVKALATLPLTNQEPSFDEDDLSPVQPLPLFQQRDNYYS